MSDSSNKSSSDASRTKPKFGSLAIKKGFISREQIQECLGIQQELKETGVNEKLGKILIKRGYMTKEQILEILQEQRGIGLTNLKGFEVVDQLGSGSMGSVYKAKQISMNRWVALKVLSKELSEDRDFLKRFLREAKAVARLHHENIVTGHDMKNEGNLYYFVMEYVEGETLKDIVEEKGALPEENVVAIGYRISRALAHAHEKNMIHRDIKPENIMINAENTPKLTDFGLAKIIDSDAPALTMAGTTMGTPYYMSPEQVRGDETIDIRTDIYSLGATLYYALTGTMPFYGKTPMAVMDKHLNEPLEPPRQRNSAISMQMNRIICRMMEKEPEARYTRPKELVNDFEQLLPGDARQSTRISQPHPPVHPAQAPTKNSWASYVIITLIACCALTFGYLIIRNQRPAPDRIQVQIQNLRTELSQIQDELNRIEKRNLTSEENSLLMKIQVRVTKTKEKLRQLEQRRKQQVK